MRSRRHGRKGRRPRVYVDLGEYTNFGAFCIARIQQKGAREAIEDALEDGNADRLRAVLKSYGVCRCSLSANKIAGYVFLTPDMHAVQCWIENIADLVSNLVKY